MNGPADGGTDPDPDNIPDGANEFTFSADTTGVLKLKFKVRKPGVVDQSATDQAKYTFAVDAIGSSVLTWGTDNTDGKAKVGDTFLGSQLDVDWPNAWPLPQHAGIWPIPLIECDAVEYSDSLHDENKQARNDWGNPGKNHQTINKWND